jgi:hypothetical protein
LLEQLKRIVVVVGHYGSGKTNLAVNLALDYKKMGQNVTLVDLDIVNPYFRSADFAGLMEEQGIGMIAPVYAGSNLDIPALTAHLDVAIETERQLIIDVGGDDAGAAALGRYSGKIKASGGCDMLYVVNGYRYLTRTAEDASEVLADIQAVSRLSVTGVVNCSNLADETTARDVADTADFAARTAQKYGVPVLFTAADERIAPELEGLMPAGMVYPVKIYVKKPWEA